jgi:hypothetical protein
MNRPGLSLLDTPFEPSVQHNHALVSGPNFVHLLSRRCEPVILQKALQISVRSRLADTTSYTQLPFHSFPARSHSLAQCLGISKADMCTLETNAHTDNTHGHVSESTK